MSCKPRTIASGPCTAVLDLHRCVIFAAKRNGCCLQDANENKPITMSPSPHPRLRFTLVAALAAVLATPGIHAAESTASPGPAAIDASADAAALASKAAYQQRITELESRATPQDEQLGEAWLGLATALQTLGEHEQAVEALGNALQALRISRGLQDVQQIPVLQLQLVSRQALQQWEELDAAYHLINYIAQRQFEVGSQPRFDALLQLGRWKIRAANENLLSGNIDEAAVAAGLYRSEIDRLEAIGGSKTQLATLYLGLAAAEFHQLQAINEQPLNNFESTSRSTTTQMQCQAIRLADGRVSQLCTTVEVPNVNSYLLSSQRKGQQLGMHLEAMRVAVMEGYYALQDASVPAEARNSLQPEMQRLTSEYNRFINDNTTTDNPRLKP